MRVICVIQARLGSTRFPRKILADLCGQPMIVHVINRCWQIRGVDDVVLAVPPENDNALSGLGQAPTPIYVTPDTIHPSDVLGRFDDVARRIQADVIMRVTGDCPLLDPDVSSLVLQRFLEEGADFASNDVTESGYPDGFDTEVFTRALLERAHAEATSAYDREHVTPIMKRLPGVRSVLVKAEPRHQWADVKLSIDTPQDLKRVQAWMNDHPEYCHPEDYKYDERA